MDAKAFVHKHKPLLDIFSGSHAHDTTDGVWRDLLAFQTPLTQLPPVDLQLSLTPFCDLLGRMQMVVDESAGLDAFLRTVAGCLRPNKLVGMQVLGGLPCQVSGLLTMSAMRSREQCSHPPLPGAGAPHNGAAAEAGEAAAALAAGGERSVLLAHHCEALDGEPERCSAGDLRQWSAPGQWLSTRACRCSLRMWPVVSRPACMQMRA